MTISLFGLSQQHAAIADELDRALSELIAESRFIGGETVRQFEAAFAQYLGTDEMVSCGNGTDALEIAMEALGLGEGDEVIVPAMTWISTAEAVVRIGARPVFADILADEWTIDPGAVREAITPRTRAVLPVHLYGRPARLNELRALCEEHGLWLIEDCAQAHGASFAGRKLGAIGDAAIFSFFPTKNLGGFGDGGAMVFANPKHARTARLIANHGQTKRHHHTMVGRNSRLDALNAAVLSIKLPYLDDNTARKHGLAERYCEALQDAGCGLPAPARAGEHGWHLFAVTHEARGALRDHLAQAGIESAVHYPHSLPEQLAFEPMGVDPGAHPQALRLAREVLSIPLHPSLSPDDQQAVIDAVGSFTP
ncbi:DegT/DnrJ/EryC1/StrS family aminotransferase [Erythrobacter sp.]|jgi:dTDP-4-amino-4,6-dideoxygalactose transaminase|uniref:DegT/DnrJ/EryC1/StrS family aminotransferase n=1 Tax=Erythrobacter sp. TaxID=1042 RepID=UPI002EC0E111|nr:DegT/DnrJ/EryC1/StrS family aminotransferase [Erythrobacter sp.]